ncbi:SHOCT domain-containing protein [Malonomonas rubra]|nr:SHOCT domain-containing protein [Malonomonas rubra]
MAKGDTKGMFSGMFVAYAVLLLHLLLIVGLGAGVVLIKGIFDFRWYILGGGTLLLCISAILFFRYLKASNKSLKEAMNDPALRDKTLEISFLGGMASVRVGHNPQMQNQPQLIDVHEVQEIKQLAAPRTQVEELSDLAKMLENDLITREEFERMKKDIVNGR